MKPVLTTVLLAAVSLCVFASISAADVLTARTKQLDWRTHRIAGTSAHYSYAHYDQIGPFYDSTATHRVGTQIMILDTTTAVITDGWARQLVSGAALDTMNTYCIVNVYDETGASCASGADSIYLAAQGSPDGTTWVTLGTFKTGAPASLTDRLSQANATGTFYGLNNLSSTEFPVWQFPYKLGILSASPTPDVFSIQRWKALRWVVGFPDAVGYNVRAEVQYFTSD